MEQIYIYIKDKKKEGWKKISLGIFLMRRHKRGDKETEFCSG